ncbi:MAG: undecaprenyl-diphosphatase, undecaprenyl-diphosphatase [Candidatus Peregrinibacteria bacterium GW2011_GWF2_38_29]|nr:MAG: undecaprenyl-diphosphatase, undecaprenyl-diphosphatase [Candidatus Peregrinibacteria bacterium GW2011_GWF2_38_29]HBB02838.1 undecaprenyl-diphosphatase [Candidatus Peregrinibacteria bacterium]
MQYIDAIIFGIIEGLTEFLPISSTGHLMLTAQVLGGQTEFLKTFEIVIQLGAILSVVVLYWRSFLVDFAVLKRVIVAFIPTGILGLIFYKIVKTYLMSSMTTVLWALAIGGAVIIAFELINKGDGGTSEIAKISYKKAALIGVFQSIAMIPGVSRSAATIIGGLSLGLSRKAIVEFSFLLAVPTMLAASSMDLYKNATAFSTSQIGFLAIGFTVSFLVAILAIKFFLKFIQKHSFTWFGVYRIIIAAIGFWLLF